MKIGVELPALGESVVEGTVSRWLVAVGDRVEVDQPLVEVTTDKVDAEIPAPSAGVVVEILAAEGDVVPVGGALAGIDPEATASSGKGRAPGEAPPAPEVPEPGLEPADSGSKAGSTSRATRSRSRKRTVSLSRICPSSPMPWCGR